MMDSLQLKTSLEIIYWKELDSATKYSKYKIFQNNNWQFWITLLGIVDSFKIYSWLKFLKVCYYLSYYLYSLGVKPFYICFEPEWSNLDVNFS